MAMSAEHKAALAEGRRQAKAIKSYLDALGSRKPGRPVTAESLGKRIETLSEKISNEADPLRRVELVQQRLDAEDQLASLADTVDFSQLEAEFVNAAKSYSERKGITYSAWREAGVPAEVLRRSAIPRTRRG
jgi:hypothetical protein